MRLFITILVILRHQRVPLSFHSSTQSQWLPSFSPQAPPNTVPYPFWKIPAIVKLPSVWDPESRALNVAGCLNPPQGETQVQVASNVHTPSPQQKVGLCLFSLTAFNIFILSLVQWYQPLHYDYTLVWFHLHSFCLEFTVFFNLWVYSFHPTWKIFGHYFSKYFSVLLLLSCGTRITH